ncbi:MAG: protein kinase domain-containing protein [Brevibacterium sp.]|uniref:protein kinase domain-containing protein n=1 Tax=Brevibacterium sp. TaxID=1701 RepID=UPI003F8ED8B7
MRPVEGTLLGNRYKLTSRIAVGGMGEVWKGVDSVLGREVAAKILKDEYLSESTFLARFRAEAQNMGRVSDPGIAGVYDYGDEQGSPYLVMEYVPGEALSAIIERSAPLSEADTLSIVTQAAAALGAAHKVGVIHRDIKPGNILMTPDFRVKITDFGIARVTDQAPLTKTGQVMGTAQYLAPEQATGKGSGPGSDLYALGIIAYEALAGQRPFTGDSQVAIAIAQVNQQHPPLPDTVSEPLRRFVHCLLEKKPERRPSDAFKVSKAAEALSAGDIAGAEELVPQMRHGAAASEALTQVFNNPEPAATTKTLPVTSSNDATQVYPNGAAAGAVGAGIVGAGAAGAGAAAANTGQIDPNGPQNQDLEKDKPSSKGRVLIWILAIIALIAVGSLLWFFLGGGNAEPEPEPSTSAPTSEAAKTIEIDKNDYIGLSESSATQNLQNKGLEVETTDINSERTAGTVADVGEGDNGYTFEEGDTVTLYISAGPAEEPQEPASDSGSDSGLGTDSESSSESDSSSSSDSDSGSDSEGSQSNSDSGSSSDSETSTDSGSEGSSETSGESDSTSSGDSADTSGSSTSSGTGSGSDSTSSANANSGEASGNSGGNNGGNNGNG